MLKSSSSAAIFFAFLAVISTVPCRADQDPSPISSSDNAAVLEKSILEDVQKKLESKSEVHVPAIEQQKPAEEPAGTEASFFVKQIILEGNSGVPASVLRPTVDPYQGHEQTLISLSRMARSIEAFYQKKGYLAYASIPRQKITDGALHIRIIESRFGDIQFTGNRFYDAERMLAYSDIRKGDVFRFEQLERFLRRLNENPARQVRASIRPGTEPGTTDIIMIVVDRAPLRTGVRLDNQGIESSGKERVGVTVHNDNLSGRDDVLVGGGTFGESFGILFTQYTLSLPFIRSLLSGGVSLTQSTPHGSLSDLGVNSLSQVYTGNLRNTLYDTTPFLVNFNTGFRIKESRTEVLSGTYNRTRLREIAFGPELRLKDAGGVTQINNELAVGIDGLGASIFQQLSTDRQGLRPDFCVYRGSLTRSQFLFKKTQGVVKVRGQLASSKLASAEAFVLGGEASVRGYPEADYLADSGIVMNLEYVFPAFFVPEEWKLLGQTTPLRQQVELLVFFDQGYGTLRGPSTLQASSRYLSGAGAGIRYRIDRDLYARLEWGYALGDRPLTGLGRSMTHVGLQMDF